MCAASLFAVHSDGTITQSKLSGMTVSSMHSIKSKPDGSSKLARQLSQTLSTHQCAGHAYFVFQDLSPVYAGQYYLLFTVFTIGAEGMKSMQSVPSDTFVVTEYKAAAPTLPPATPLTKSLADSGVKLRLRKEAAYVAHPNSWSSLSNVVLESARLVPQTGPPESQRFAQREPSEPCHSTALSLEVLSQSAQPLCCTGPILGFPPRAKASRTASYMSLTQTQTFSIFQFLTPILLFNLSTYPHRGLALTRDPLTLASPC